jgi:transposase
VPRSSKYPEQFRRDAVELVRTSDRPLRQVARDLGVNHEILRNWVKTAEKLASQPSGGSATTDPDELRALRKRVAELGPLERPDSRNTPAGAGKAGRVNGHWGSGSGTKSSMDCL